MKPYQGKGAAMLGRSQSAAVRAAAVSVVVGVLLALSAASAYAGDWMQVVCQNPPAPGIATATVGAGGRFRYTYRASPLLAGYRFRFRALTPALAGYWQSAISTVTQATVTE